MISNKKIATIQINDIESLLVAYQRYSGNSVITTDELFLFLTVPSPERDSFLADNCTCTLSANANIISSIYNPL